MEPGSGMSARDYAQVYVLKNPSLNNFFGKFFPGLAKTTDEMLDLYVKDTDNLAVLKEQLFFSV